MDENNQDQVQIPQFTPAALDKSRSKTPIVIVALVILLIVVVALILQIFRTSRGPLELTEAQKLDALSKPSSTTSVTPLSEKEKLSILSKLGENKSTITLSEEEKLQILQQLGN